MGGLLIGNEAFFAVCLFKGCFCLKKRRDGVLVSFCRGEEMTGSRSVVVSDEALRNVSVFLMVKVRM